MDEKQAWERFCKSGKVQDYISYRQLLSGAVTQTPNLREEQQAYAAYGNGSSDTGAEHWRG